MKKLLYHLFSVLFFIAVFYACASPGTPDGGPYDEMPPRFLGSSPQPNATNVKQRKVYLEFDEYIKLEKASEKVIISPPQVEAPEIKTSGRRVVVEFLDTLKSNTTYTIDFGDAIVDNNEGNPMGFFSYAFSTGETIDTMEVSGTVLNAENLEPIKGLQVGLHANLNDTAFTKTPFLRIGRTDSRGRFVIRGIAPGKYHVFALKDGNQNYMFDSKTETIAFLDSVIVPTSEPAVRQDTTFNVMDSLIYDTIRTIHYTRYMPDNLVLRAFKEPITTQYLMKSDRTDLFKLMLKFSAPADTLPSLRGLNFDERNAWVVEANRTNDSIVYWVKDSLLYEQDTLRVELNYLATDTLGKLVSKTDTLNFTNKIPKERRLLLAAEELKKLLKERKKQGIPDSVPLKTIEPLRVNLAAPSTLDLDKNIDISFDEPLARVDTSKIRLFHKVDTLWNEERFIFRQDTVAHRKYELLAEWKPGEEYRLEIDSAAFTGLYGQLNEAKKQTLKVKKLEEYGTLFLTIQGVGKYAFVELLNGSDKVVRRQLIGEKGNCDFYFLQPNTKYYARIIDDTNNNGRWDTGDYTTKRQPEAVYYFPGKWEMKADFEVEEKWDVSATPVEKQKPDEIKKQKPEANKKVQERNKERLLNKGKTNNTGNNNGFGNFGNMGGFGSGSSTDYR